MSLLRKSVHPSNSRWLSLLKRRQVCSTASKNTKDFYDITIVGGGMVGGSLACALGKTKYFGIPYWQLTIV